MSLIEKAVDILEEIDLSDWIELEHDEDFIEVRLDFNGDGIPLILRRPLGSIDKTAEADTDKTEVLVGPAPVAKAARKRKKRRRRWRRILGFAEPFLKTLVKVVLP